jgi:hypothetical protein
VRPDHPDTVLVYRMWGWPALTVAAGTAFAALVAITWVGPFRVAGLVFIAAAFLVMAGRFAYRVELGPDALVWHRWLGGGTCDIDQVLKVTHSRRSRMILSVHVMGERSFVVGGARAGDALIRELRRRLPDLPVPD